MKYNAEFPEQTELRALNPGCLIVPARVVPQVPMKPPCAGRLSWTLPRGSTFCTFRAPAAGSPRGPHPFAPHPPESLMQMPLAPGGRPGAATQAEPWTLSCLGGHTLSRATGSLCRSGSPRDLTPTPRHPTWSILAGMEEGAQDAPHSGSV